MTPYFVVIGILGFLALIQGAGARSRTWPGLALVVLLIFGGLRYETGFDWMAYNDAYDLMPGLVDVVRYGETVPETDTPMEPGYVAVSILLKSMTDDAAVLLSLASLFSIVTIHWVASKISRSQCIVWVVYFGLAFLAAQMSAARAAIASSLVLLGLLAAARSRPITGTAAIAAAIGFHSAAAVFLPLPWLVRWRPPQWLLVIMAAGGSVCVAWQVPIVDTMIGVLIPYVPHVAADKLSSYYLNAEPAPLSLATAALIGGYIVLLVLFARERGERQRDPYITVALWLTVYMLLAHLYLEAFPAIWNRVMYVALPWQIAALWRTQAISSLGQIGRVAVVGGLGSLSAAALVYFLLSPAALPFVPYQSAIQAWWTGDPGDGRERSVEWYLEYQASLGGQPQR